ncbi:caspase family protein [Dyadobacter sp. CY261]|uniref:caspase family protein n=1 Tax=Dyadobacter sp. CY261 TaxID=2907203 RepID=UPI001F2B5899|nr:caspase family protein [Dyadobacter sp. CY261]MCF0075025.1 caspase family protein [Dyadobacter sp. CY261]
MNCWKQHFLLWTICITAGHHSLAQHNTGRENTYAVIVGISEYQNTALSTLQFADKDATMFAAYLQSKAGGNVPVDNIRLLLNENATIAEIYGALTWLQERCTENDKAYFYFSGHGDVETQNTFSLGYLLGYNSPPNNYRNNAITIEDLNKVANHLSAQSNATVVLVTDACHTGKLAGDYYKGRQLVANQLRLILNNEVRLAACGVDEKAAEGNYWGGGRGVFSYYLLKGLNGHADRNHNDTIQLRELGTYLDSAFASDKALIRNAYKQRPVLAGNPNQPMAVVNTGEPDGTTSHETQDENYFKSLSRTFKPLAKQPIDYFFRLMQTGPIENKLHFATYGKISRDSLPLKIINDCIAYQQRLKRQEDSLMFTDPDNTGSYSFADTDTLLLLKNQLLRSKALANRFNDRFIQTVHGIAQDMVNAYLEGDVAELEKRQYYYTGDRRYGDFIQMLRIALQITPEQDYLHQLLAVQEAYISGLIVRLEMATWPNSPALLTRAIRAQQRAMKLEPYAAYIYNELGNLYMRSKQYVLADREFNTAKEYAPTWAIPWSNQIRLNLATGNLKKAAFAVRVADSLQNDLSYTFMNAGLVMAKQGNLFAAESYFQKAISKNNIHFLPYERLGDLYIRTGDYKKADWFLAAAYSRKKDFAINDKSFTYGVELGGPPTLFVRQTGSGDVPGDSATPAETPYPKLMNALRQIKSNPDAALQTLETLTKELSGGLHLAYHYMGKLLYTKQKWREAELLFLEAVRSYQSDSAMIALLKPELKLDYNPDSLTVVHLPYQYDLLEDHYLLGSTYEHQRKISQASEEYSLISKIENRRQLDQATFKDLKTPPGTAPDAFRQMVFEGKFGGYEALISRYESPIQMGGYIKLANLYERSGNYLMAEKTLLEQVRQNREAGNVRHTQTNSGPFQLISGIDINFYWLAINRTAEAYTYAFYQRMLRIFPRESDWQQKAGMFLYSRLRLAFQKTPPERYKAVYENINYYAYPFALMDETSDNNIEISFTLPGIDEQVVVPTPKYDPVKSALENLELAVTLSGDLQPDPKMLEAIADLNAWMGNGQAAMQAYKTLLGQQEPGLALRNKIIDYSFSIYESVFAMDQLKILYRLNLTTPEQNIKLAECYALSGARDQAFRLLKTARIIGNSSKPPIPMLNARVNWLTGNNIQALHHLQLIPTEKPGDMVDDGVKEAAFNRYYSIARMNALLKQNSKALIALKKALETGFNFGYVLNTDPAWTAMRASAEWKKLKKQYAAQLEAIDYKSETYEHWVSALDYRIPD